MRSAFIIRVAAVDGRRQLGAAKDKGGANNIMGVAMEFGRPIPGQDNYLRDLVPENQCTMLKAFLIPSPFPVYDE